MSFYIYTLGCKVNTYESQVIINDLISLGYKLTDKETADIFIINTCVVTNTAENKSLQMIRQARRKNPNSLIVVCGCLGQLKPSMLEEMQIDIVIGNKDKSKIAEYINQYREPIKKIYDLNNIEFENMQVSFNKQTRAFVKIQDGCDNYCSYCIIPYTRGGLRSKKKSLVLQEITNLVINGHKEVVLTGIHTGHYDDNGYKLVDLLKDILIIPNLKRVRISSIEITEINDELIELLKDEKLANHLHIPLQSGSNRILKLMNRKYEMAYYYDIVSKIRKIKPDINITTDIIVGFPTESLDDFEEMVFNIKKIGFSKLHVFPYSIRENTPAADMEQIDDEIKKRRTHRLLELSKGLEVNYMSQFINKKIAVLIETYKDGYLYGHTSNYLLIKASGGEELINQIVDVIVVEITYPYCLSKICQTNFDKLVQV